MTTITIQKGIPVTQSAGRPQKYPFSELKTGNSFTIKAKTYSALTCANAWANRMNNGWKFKGSLVKGHLTIWRIK